MSYFLLVIAKDFLTNDHGDENYCPRDSNLPLIPLNFNQREDNEEARNTRFKMASGLKYQYLIVNSFLPSRLTFIAAIINLILLSVAYVSHLV